MMMNICFDPFPLLTTSRLALRPIEKSDTERVLSLRSDPRVMQYIDRPLAKSKLEAREWIENIQEMLINQQGITWGISLNNDSRLLGSIGFWRIEKEHFRAEIGYMLTPELQGKGIMQEAMKVAIEYGFDVMNLHSIEANVNPENKASIKILERNGFVQKAFFKENFYYEGKFLDTIIFSLLKPNRK